MWGEGNNGGAWWFRGRVNAEGNGGERAQGDGLGEVGMTDGGPRTVHKLGKQSADKALLALS